MRTVGIFLYSSLLHLIFISGVDASYTVKACVAESLKHTCAPTVVATKRTEQPVSGDCGHTYDQKGSVTWADLTLPEGEGGGVLLVEVTTAVSGQSTDKGFFVRPSRRTRQWGRAELNGKKSATFYLAETGQYSVEFASSEFWRTEAALSFDSLMLFVNPKLSIPSNAKIIGDDSTAVSEDLGPNEVYVFAADYQYDWGADHVFKVHDNTQIYFEVRTLLLINVQSTMLEC